MRVEHLHGQHPSLVVNEQLHFVGHIGPHFVAFWMTVSSICMV